MKKNWICGLLLAMAVTTMLTACQPSQNWTPTITNQATDFELPDLDGQMVSLSGLRGRPVMVNFWATWCGPCNHEMPFIQAVYEQWPESDLVILTVNIKESAAKVQQLMDGNNYSFTVLLDSDGQVAEQYQISGIPTTLFIDKEGIIQKMKIGAYAGQADLEADLTSLMGD
jgi:thiol-disulfide isomerase/thioredoxin